MHGRWLRKSFPLWTPQILEHGHHEFYWINGNLPRFCRILHWGPRRRPQPSRPSNCLPPRQNINTLSMLKPGPKQLFLHVYQSWSWTFRSVTNQHHDQTTQQRQKEGAFHIWWYPSWVQSRYPNWSSYWKRGKGFLKAPPPLTKQYIITCKWQNNKSENCINKYSYNSEQFEFSQCPLCTCNCNHACTFENYFQWSAYKKQETHQNQNK